jgi:hypothetical protein
MNSGESDSCPHTAAVLARLLDGDVAPPPAAAVADADCGAAPAPRTADPLTTDPLTSHARDCRPCQQTLRRARRLDALLAQGSGMRRGADPQARRDQWLLRATADATTAGETNAGVATAGRATAIHSAAPPIEPVVRSRGRAPAVVAALAAATFAIVLLRWPAAPTATPQLPPTPSAIGLAVPTEPAAFRLPNGLPPRQQRRERIAVEQRVAASPTELEQRLATEDLPLSARLAAAHDLLDRTRATAPAAAPATAALLQAIAGCGDRDVPSQQLHDQLLQMLLGAPWLLDRIADRLQRLDAPGTALQSVDLACLTIAARLDLATIDEALRRAIRRHPDAAPVLCAALRCTSRADGGASLLLDTWRDLVTRAHVADDERTARLWFTGQPDPMFAAIGRELRDSSDATRRRHCLLALAHATDADSCRLLQAWLHSQRRDEAHLAAHALSRLPRHRLQQLVPDAAASEAALLRAALAAADLPAARPWVAPLSLRADQRHRLRHAAPADFPMFASWFRHAPSPGPAGSDPDTTD